MLVAFSRKISRRFFPWFSSIFDAQRPLSETHEHISIMANTNDDTPLTERELRAFVRMVIGASQRGFNRQSEEIRQGYADRRERRRVLRAIRSLVGLVLICAGFVRYRRGPWKRKVMKSLPGPINDVSESQELAVAIRRLANAVVDGDDTALAPLQRIRHLHPVAFASVIGWNLTDLAHNALAVSYAGASPERYRSMRVQLKLESEKLAGHNPSPAMRCCANWAVVLEAHASIESARVAISEQGGQNLGPVSREYLHSLKTLAQINSIEARRTRRARPKARTINATFKGDIP
jgi:hypothetical protein